MAKKATKAKKNDNGALVCNNCGSRVHNEKTAYCSDACEQAHTGSDS